MKYITRIAAIRQCEVDCIMSTELRLRTTYAVAFLPAAGSLEVVLSVSRTHYIITKRDCNTVMYKKTASYAF